ncbi:hypothetical protein HELRODRAFT_191757 [Helobdella robusta]|uniref:Uncharacterized protein n=1 Tax=Helobdella robusta TaxID=6412 RepID=T1FTA1_HELRO|nr:hypothetical protein HELRODRAFT_191757 [Helobdella robusta]ESO04282.1 hypothetical protein HELRODRAFT_191757 [Helobdella robusta]
MIVLTFFKEDISWNFKGLNSSKHTVHVIGWDLFAIEFGHCNSNARHFTATPSRRRLLATRSTNREQALLCLLFSVMVGVACLLSAILCCVCCRWKSASKKGTFNVAHDHADGKTKNPIRLFLGKKKSDKEHETLLGEMNSKGDIYKPSPNISGSGIAAVSRPYSSPRSVRHEFARGSITGGTVKSGNNNSSTLTTPSSTLNHPNINTNNPSNTPTNAQVVGLYLSQAPKSRWSRASDAVPWPIPPSTVSTLEHVPPHSTGTGRSNAQNQQMPIISEGPSTFLSNLPSDQVAPTQAQHSPTKPKLYLPSLQQQQQSTPQQQFPQQQFQSSPTDYLFNRDSVSPTTRSAELSEDTNSTEEAPPIFRRSPNVSKLSNNSSPSFQTDNTPQRQTFPVTNIPPTNLAVSSYISGVPVVSPRMMINSPPVVPAPASSPWPVRDSQVPTMIDESSVVVNSNGSTAWNRRA